MNPLRWRTVKVGFGPLFQVYVRFTKVTPQTIPEFTGQLGLVEANAIDSRMCIAVAENPLRPRLY